MYNTTGLFHSENQLIIDLVPARATAFARLNTNRTALAAAIGGQSVQTTGSTKDNQLMRSNLVTLTFAILQPSAAWATIVENNTLRDQFNVSKSELKDIKDETFPAFCRERLTLVNDNLIALADYGITAAITTVWATAIDNYDAALGRPRLAVTTRSTKTQTIKSLISETGKLLKNVIDPLMAPFQTQDPELFDGYTKARIIIDRRGQGNNPTPPTPSVDIKIDGTVAGNMFPLPNASITVTVGATSYPTIAGPAGIYAVSIPNPAPSTAATITASAPNFTPETRNITLEPNQNQTQDFNLTSAPPMP